MNQIPYSNEKPPVYDRLASKFGVNWNDGLIIAYDGKIHSKTHPEPAKIMHESVHLAEQKRLGNEVWWECYFTSDEFRREQEILAYKAEARFLKKYIKNREVLYHMVQEIADNLASSVYGNLMSKSEAFKIINK